MPGSVQPKNHSQKEKLIDQTELDIEIEQVKAELKAMNEEAQKYNTPEHYAKYGKLQRQIVQKEKVLSIMVKENL